MCGKECFHLYKALVEGTLISVCDECKKFGDVIEVVKPRIEEKEERRAEPKFVDEEKQEIVVDDYASIVKRAREKKELTQEGLAKAIAEKESIIHKIEAGQIVPSLKLAKKLEQFLRVKLIEEFDPNKKPAKEFDIKDETLTVGDLIRLKKK